VRRTLPDPDRTVTTRAMQIGDHLRHWRRRRRLSQLACSLEVNVSQRHLSFIESGRARPSRQMVLQLARHLDVPLRDRNAMLLAAGYAPVYPERPVQALGPARNAIERILRAHEPNPALVLDRHFNMVTANATVPLLLRGVADPALLDPPVNVLRLSLHPGGLAPHIRNFAAWREHLLQRLEDDLTRSGDAGLHALQDELLSLSAPPTSNPQDGPNTSLAGIAVPLEISVDGVLLRFISTTTVFGTPIDVTLSEIALESFFPADAATAEALSQRHSDALVAAAAAP
jgi:transcriptional regulator with XRE-family HTH domain